MVLHRSLAVVLASVLVLGACSKSKDKIPVAKVGDRTITLAKFEEAYNKVDPKFLPKKKGLEGLKEFLDTMIKKEIMAIKADELGYDKDPYIVQGMELYRKMGLQAAYLKFRVADKIKVTEDDLRYLYDNSGTVLNVKQILVDTKEEADSVYQLLKEGNDFETICKRYSKAPDAEEGGRVLTAAFGTFFPAFQNEVFSLPVGGISKPIESPYGFFIVKVLKREKRPNVKSFEEERERLERLARGYKEMLATAEVSKRIQKKFKVKWYNDALRICFDALPPDRPITNPPPRSEEKYPLLHFDEEVLDMPVVSYKDKVITIKDFSDMYDDASFFERPRREYRWGGIKRFLTETIMNELVADEMEDSGIEKEKPLQELLKKKQEELMVSKMYDDLIKKQVFISEREIQDYYENNRELFKVPEKRRFGVVLTADRESAMDAYEKLRGGAGFQDVVLAYSIDEETKDRQGQTELMARGEQPEIDEVGFALEKVGEISQPFQTSRGWVILKLIEKQRERIMPLSEARRSVEATLMTLKTEEKLKEKIEEWKKDIEVVIYEDNLAKAEVQERIGVTAQAAKR